MTELQKAQDQIAAMEAENQRAQAASSKRIAELEEKERVAKIQLGLAMSGTALPAHLAADVQRRIQGGLTPDQAKDCALRQWENDLKVTADARALAEINGTAVVIPALTIPAAATATVPIPPTIAPLPAAPVEVETPAPKGKGK